MILPFSTQLNGKPTYFIEKIITGLAFKKLISFDEANERIQDTLIQKYNKQGELVNFFIKLDRTRILSPKIHTIREDKTDRWKPGTKIDFFINCRQPNMFRFAPVLPVVSVQKIEIKFFEYLNDVEIRIDGKLNTTEQNQELAWNDGFENLLMFLMYFNEDFTGKIIHWTDKKY